MTLYSSKTLQKPNNDQQHNAPNPLLVRFRKWTQGENLADPTWSETWLDAMASPDLTNEASHALDELYETPYRRREREHQEDHARRVIGRIARAAR